MPPAFTPAPQTVVPQPARVGAPRRARWRNAFIITAAITSTLLGVGGYDVRHGLRQYGSSEAMTDTAMVIFLCGIAAVIVMSFRGRARAPIALALCLVPVVLPLDPFPALVAMASVLVWVRDVRLRLLVAAAAAVATFVATYRDTRSGPRGASFINDMLAGGVQNPTPRQDMPLVQVVLLTALALGVFIAAALFRRNRLQLKRVDSARVTAERQRDVLEHRVAGQEASDLIAREVHDVLGHRLSLLSMQASALEVEAEGSGDPDVIQRAKQLQTGAQAAMTDLRSLVHTLRDGSLGQPKDGDIGDIAQLIDECMQAGTPVASNIFVDTSTPLAPVVSSAAHRITSELLTNARKHSPGAPVRLNISGSPAVGLTIRAANPLQRGAQGVGNGSGLNGIHQRASELGGTFHVQSPSADGMFVATVTLPWFVDHRGPNLQ